MMQQRTMASRPTRFRAEEENGELFIEGYFSVFNSPYELGPGLVEVVAPGAFDGALDDDVRALTNHDTTLVLGRLRAGTLELRQDERGLWGRIRINRADQDAMNLYSRVQRGDVDQCSFGFDILEEERVVGEDGSVTWIIRRVRLYEVSVVTFPAYEETSVSARSREAAEVQTRRLEARRQQVKNKLKGD